MAISSRIMTLLILSSECFVFVLIHMNQVKSYPQNNIRTSPHQVDCTVSLRPEIVMADSPSKTECACIPYYLCNNNGTTDAGAGVGALSGVGLVSIPPYQPCSCSQAVSSPKPNNAGVCPNFLDVCCEQQPQVLSDEYPDNQPSVIDNLPENSPPWQNIPVNYPPWFNNYTTKFPPWNAKPTENDHSWTYNKPWRPETWNNNSPGRSPSDSQTSDSSRPWKEKYPACGNYFTSGWRFQNWQEEDSDLPWMVAVFGDKIMNGAIKRKRFLCGGSLINPDVVLTIAHCVKGKTSLMVRAGRGGEERLVHHVKIHEEFYAGALYNDIALLFLDQPLGPGPDVGTVCLSNLGLGVNLNECVVSGWGTRVFGESENYGSALKKIELSVVPRNVCEEKLRTTRLGRYFHLHEGFICALGKRGQDACTNKEVTPNHATHIKEKNEIPVDKGDGGGPLMCPSTDRSAAYVQVGIVSWGIGCGGEIPGVYTNVSHYRHWIDSQMKALTLDKRFGH